MKNMIALATLFLNLSICADLVYITNPNQSDGFGSQFQGIIAAAIYAELAHKQFVYTPFQSMEHNYDNNPTFLAQKENFINFMGNFALNTGQYSASRSIHYKTILDKFPDLCAQSTTLTEIKRVFRANKDADYFKNNRFNIAIHIRRPNQHDSRVEGADTPDILFLKIIGALRKQYADENPLFHLYSQGDVAKFAVYQADDSILHLDEPLEDTFLGLVFADVLVTSASSFSYTAALLSDSIIYYVPFWHTPFPGWISVHELIKNVNLAER